MAFYPLPSSAGTGIVVVPCVHPSVCPVPKDVTALNFKGYFRDLPEIHYCEAQYHDADCYSKWPCSVDFSAFHRTLKFSMIGLHQVWGTAFQLKCKLVKAWNLVGLYALLWSRFTFENRRVWPFLRVPWNFEMFHAWHAWTRSNVRGWTSCYPRFIQAALCRALRRLSVRPSTCPR